MGAGKKVLLGIGIFFLLAIIGVFFIYKSITGSSTVTAQIIPESGSVLVNANPITANTMLKQGDIIQTGSDGQANVILYESVLVSLEPGTKVSLDDLTKQHPQIAQESGETWSKFTKLSGVEEYSVKTGNSVASVRGTAFGIKDNELLVGEGNVDYKVKDMVFIAGENEIIINENGNPVKRAINAAERERIKLRMQRTLKGLEQMRELEIKKNQFIVNRIKAMQGWDDNKLKEMLRNADEGQENIDELVNKFPIKVEGLRKIADHTREIRKIREKIKNLQLNSANLSLSR